MKINQHLPSIFTLINLFLGFIAIINIQQGNYDFACYVLLAAGAFDSIDGKLARMLDIPTNFGKEIDVIVGGPPCQAFSSSGKQLSVLDSRGKLVNEFLRLVDEQLRFYL